jgi:F0F1-type ATP synthase membrane subunit c/vacuolar-type H+-ATPase subunit K
VYDFLLFVHVLFAFTMVAAVTLFWALIVSSRPGRQSLTPAGAMWLGRAGAITVGIGSLGALVFGVWLAIYVDGYELWDGWILASLVFWAIAVPVGARGGRYFERAAREPENAAALRRTGLTLQTIASTALLLVLVMMIFKPGA